MIVVVAHNAVAVIVVVVVVKGQLTLSVVVRTSRTSWNFEEPSYRTIRCGSFLNRLRLSLVVSKKEGTGREKQRFEDSESNERHQLTNLLDKTN